MICFLQKLSFVILICILASGFCFAQKSNGFFRVEQRNGIWWFITPAGKPFFSNGVNVIDIGTTRENYKESNPEYASFLFYKNDKDWQDETLRRLKSWNFNTIGGWSDENLEKRGEMPYVKTFWWGEKLIPWGDVFSKETENDINEKAKREILPLKDDKNLIGYFTDNELGWWDDAVFYHFLEQPIENKTRQVLLKLLRETYKDNFTSLKRDFETGKANSFSTLELESQMTLKPNGNGAKVIDKFMFLIASRYYKMVHDAIRRYDKNHLILGDRYPSWYSQAVVRASIPYVDVVSTNYMADWNDGNFSRFYLDSLHRLTKKPIIITEYYLAAMENRSGNKNSKEMFPTVQTQKERAEGFRTNLTKLAKLPYVIGAHWFQYYDEPTNGRSDGEDYNMGLLDIHNKPYEELTDAAKSLKPWEIHAKKSVERIENFVPKAIKDVEKGLRDWNKTHSFVAPNLLKQTNLPFADLYASWNSENLYLAIYAMDYADSRIYPNGQISDSEQMTLTLNLAGNSKPVRILFGNGSEPKVIGDSIEFKSFGRSTRYTALIKLPASKFGKAKFKQGDKILLNAKLKSHSRAETMNWNQSLKLGEIISE